MKRLYKISKIEGIFLFDKSLANSVVLEVMYQQFDAPVNLSHKSLICWLPHPPRTEVQG
jgi:hypothetical protein